MGVKMNDYKEYLILTSTPEAYDQAGYRAVVLQGDHTDGRTKVMITHTENPLIDGDTLVYGFDPYTGKKTEPFDEVLYQEIVPLGNNPDGSATCHLGFSTWAGAEKRMCGDEDSADPMVQLYPGTPPFEIMVEHFWYEQAEFSGFGFLAEIKGGAETRDPSVRAMGVYSDPECTAYLWTGGAYQLGPSRLGQIDEVGDEEGNGVGEPLMVWFSDTPAGQRTQEQKDWHLACLFGSAQEGHATLEVGESLLLQFWDHNQTPVGTEWIDTGATITAQFGTIYEISDEVVCAALVPNQKIRFTETGAEVTFTGLRTGYTDQIEIDPFVQATIGDPLWSFE